MKINVWGPVYSLILTRAQARGSLRVQEQTEAQELLADLIP